MVFSDYYYIVGVYLNFHKMSSLYYKANLHIDVRKKSKHDHFVKLKHGSFLPPFNYQFQLQNVDF